MHVGEDKQMINYRGPKQRLKPLTHDTKTLPYFEIDFAFSNCFNSFNHRLSTALFPSVEERELP